MWIESRLEPVLLPFVNVTIHREVAREKSIEEKDNEEESKKLKLSKASEPTKTRTTNSKPKKPEP